MLCNYYTYLDFISILNTILFDYGNILLITIPKLPDLSAVFQIYCLTNLYFHTFNLLLILSIMVTLLDDVRVCHLTAAMVTDGISVNQQVNVNLFLLFCFFTYSYWTCSHSGIGQRTWLTTANLPASTWEWTHTLRWPCWRSEWPSFICTFSCLT